MKKPYFKKDDSKKKSFRKSSKNDFRDNRSRNSFSKKLSSKDRFYEKDNNERSKRSFSRSSDSRNKFSSRSSSIKSSGKFSKNSSDNFSARPYRKKELGERKNNTENSNYKKYDRSGLRERSGNRFFSRDSSNNSSNNYSKKTSEFSGRNNFRERNDGKKRGEYGRKNNFPRNNNDRSKRNFGENSRREYRKGFQKRDNSGFEKRNKIGGDKKDYSNPVLRDKNKFSKNFSDKKLAKKEENKRYYKKTDDNYLSKRFKRDYKDDVSHKPKSPLIRLNKYLYEKNICSRREGDKFIKQGLISVNGKKAIIGQKINPIKDNIRISDSVKKEIKNKIVVALYKPKGYVSENPQDNEKDVSQLLPFTEKLSALGRLDKNSSGLLLLTNDGKIVNQLLNPDFNHEKEYLVKVDRRISTNFIKKMKEGVDIGGYVTKKARAKKLSEDTFTLVLTEGKNHQIKKMTNALGYTVRELKRTRFNNIKLGNLKSGKYRVIEGKEYLRLVGKF